MLLLALLLASHLFAQMGPLNPRDARTAYSFAVAPGIAPFRFQVHIDNSGAVTAVSVFRTSGTPSLLQTIRACNHEPQGLTIQEKNLELLKHADFNFDGFEDLQLLQYYVPHLAKRKYCIYVWDRQSGLFRSAPEVPEIDPIAHSDRQEITVHEDWLGGEYADRTYRWHATKLELIEEFGWFLGSEDPKCSHTYSCLRLPNGQLVSKLKVPSGCKDRPAPKTAPVCPP